MDMAMIGCLCLASWILFVDHFTTGDKISRFMVYPSDNVRLLNHYKTVLSTKFECLVQCHTEAVCVSTSYDETEGTCQLNDDAGGYETATGWKIYTKDLCPDGWLSNENSCYFFSTFETNWYDAAELCNDEGAHLVQIGNENEQDFIDQKLAALHSEPDSFIYWTDGNDIDDENHWVWGLPGQEMTFQNWHNGEPNSMGGPVEEDCLALYGLLTFGWVDYGCEGLAFYICEKQLSLGTPPH